MGVMKKLDIEFHNSPDTIKYLRHEVERIEKKLDHEIEQLKRVGGVMEKVAGLLLCNANHFVDDFSCCSVCESCYNDKMQSPCIDCRHFETNDNSYECYWKLHV